MVRVLGTVAGYYSSDPQITLSQQGREVSVLIVTYGPGCYKLGETEVRVEGLNATVMPFDYAPQPGSPCTRDLEHFEHATTLEFPSSGTAQIVVRGLTVEDDPYGEPIEFELAVTLN